MKCLSDIYFLFPFFLVQSSRTLLLSRMTKIRILPALIHKNPFFKNKNIVRRCILVNWLLMKCIHIFVCMHFHFETIIPQPQAQQLLKYTSYIAPHISANRAHEDRDIF